jgi:hypothetical protein
MKESAAQGIWPTQERLLVCINEAPVGCKGPDPHWQANGRTGADPLDRRNGADRQAKSDECRHSCIYPGCNAISQNDRCRESDFSHRADAENALLHFLRAMPGALSAIASCSGQFGVRHILTMPIISGSQSAISATRSGMTRLIHASSSPSPAWVTDFWQIRRNAH